MHQTEKKLPFGSSLLLGATSGVIGGVSTFPIDIVKTRLQAQKQHIQYKGAFDCARKMILHEGGIRALYRGCTAVILGMAPEKGLKLSVNDFLRRLCNNYLKGNDPYNLPIRYEIICGLGTAFVQLFATCPMELVKIQMQLQYKLVKEGKLKEMKSIWRIIKELGFTGLYKGFAATALRDIPFTVMYFGLYAKMRTPLIEKIGVLGGGFVAGSIAGMISAGLTNPCDVIKTRLQEKHSVYKSIPDAFHSILRNEGPSAFFKGIIPRVSIIAPLFGVVLMSYEVQKKLFGFT